MDMLDLSKRWAIQAFPDQRKEIESLPAESVIQLYPEFLHYGSNPKKTLDVINVLLLTAQAASPIMQCDQFIADWRPLHVAIPGCFKANQALLTSLRGGIYPKVINESVAEKMQWLTEVGLMAMPTANIAGLRMSCYYAFLRDPMLLPLPGISELDLTFLVYLTLVDPELGKIFLPKAQIDEVNQKFEALKARQATADYDEARMTLINHPMWNFTIHDL